MSSWTLACQPPLSIEFSRQEYRSALPFLSPGDLPDPGIEPGSPALQADSLPFEPPGKPENTGVGSLFLLQGIFLTQELNWNLLHCKRILICCCSVAKSHPTLCYPMDCSMPGLPVHHQLPEQTSSSLSAIRVVSSA